MLHEVNFKSYNERDEIYAWVYVPASEIKGIIQIVHGFGEHSRRYLPMIVDFMESGFIVAADDHVGHGKTALENDSWGDWGDKGPHTMMEDEHKLKTKVQELYPDLPYFMYGHSMGSMITREFMSKYGDELDGAVICGTCGIINIPETAKEKLAKLIEEGKGDQSDPEVLSECLGWMCERCGDIKYGNEWICHDEYVQKDHATDPFNSGSRPILNKSLHDFIIMADQTIGKEWAEKVPKELPILNIAGDQDPVGNYGEGVYQVSNWLIETGHDVKNKVYPGYRHEIHNYKDIKDEVSNEIISFYNGIL